MTKILRKKLKIMALSALTIAVVSGASIRPAWSYFTTYTQGHGGMTIHLGDETTVEEEFSNWTKQVTISNSADSQAVYVRVRAYCGSRYELVYSGDEKWSPGDEGWYYYSDIVPGGASTDTLSIQIDNVPADVTDGDSFNIIVVYESTPVLYGEDGAALPADWDSSELEIHKTGSGM